MAGAPAGVEDDLSAMGQEKRTLHSQTVQKVAAVLAVHGGKVHSSDIKQTLGQDRRVIVPVTSALAHLPVDTEQTLGLRRAAFRELGAEDQMHREYTNLELRKGLKAAMCGISQKEVRQLYGVAEKSLDNYAQKIGVQFGFVPPKVFRQVKDFVKTSEANASSVMQFIDTLEIVTAGRPGYLSASERNVVFMYSAQREEYGFGTSRRKFKTVARDLVHAKGEDLKARAQTEREIKFADRLLDAKCGKAFVAYNTHPSNIAVVEASLKSPFQKNTPLSLKRQAAADPGRAKEMYAKADAMYKDHHESGILLTRRPLASQIIGGDEKGQRPGGVTLAKLSRGKRGARGYDSTTTDSGHSAFWTTIFFWQAADGKLIGPPIVIHEAGSETTNTITAASVLGLSKDFIPHATASGYMDNEGWRMAADILVKYGRAALSHPLYPKIDAFDAHWDPFAMDHFKRNYIYPMFLTSNNSTNDQPHDMGSNSALAAHYDTAMDNWSYNHPGQAVDVLVFNVVLSNAWAAFASHRDTPGIIQRSFCKAGWFPLRVAEGSAVDAGQLLEQHAMIAAPTKAEFASGKRNACMAFALAQDDTDRAKLQKRVEDSLIPQASGVMSITPLPVQIVSDKQLALMGVTVVRMEDRLEVSSTAYVVVDAAVYYNM